MQASIIEASDRLQKLAEPAPAGAHIETLISNVARKVGFTYSRAKAIWYREARRIDSTEMDALRKASREEKLEVEVATARADYAQLVALVRQLQQALEIYESKNMDR